ncbi:(2Fe-2S)-binding protein [Streptomyces sp. NPDC048710]|uniref:(2Fe-2S)-binding protein n=1 Tax=unclassified Streptomyces TaxID=2593676 RepID=UPI00371053D9
MTDSPSTDRPRIVEVDGTPTEIVASPWEATAWWLREQGHTSVRVGCEEGTCGACVVLVDGTATPSCLLPVGRLADGTRIATARTLHACPEGAALVDALADDSVVQCGFCTPGIVASCVAAHREGLDLGDAEVVRNVLSSHVCRCSGYTGLVRAITRKGTAEVSQQK